MATYRWEVGNVLALPSYTDKNGILRTNVVRNVTLYYIGESEARTERIPKSFKFSLIDLRNFTPTTELTKSELIEWCLATLHPMELADFENSVKRLFGDDPEKTTPLISINIQN